MPKIILKINKNSDNTINNDNICCYIIGDSISEQKISEVVNTGKMVLVQGDDALNFCQRYNLDGVVFEVDANHPIKAQLKPLREKLKKKTFGVIIPPRRHEAMLASETEPEFVVFKIDNLPDNEALIDWYNELFVLPSAVEFTDKIPNIGVIKSDFVIIDSEKFENSGC